jgi:hypothetical protein
MDVIGFLYVSLGSSTVQLHDILGSRYTCPCSEVGFSSQNGDRASECTTKEQRSVVPLFMGKRLTAKLFIKKCFKFTVGSVCRVKRSTTGWQNFRWWRRDWNGGAEMAEATVKRLLCCGFRRTGKAAGQVYQCWWKICREMNDSFQVWISYVLWFISICHLFTDSSS